MTTRLLTIYSTGVQRGKWVDCPQKEDAVSLSECVRCDDGQGLMLKQGLVYQKCEISVDDGRTAAEVPVEEIMSKRVVTLQIDTPVEAVAWLLLNHHGLTGAPVVDDSGRLVGIITPAELTRAQMTVAEGVPNETNAGPPGSLQIPEVRLRQRDGQTAKDVMRPVAQTLVGSAPIAVAATVMVERRIRHIPIVSEVDPGLLVGIVSSTDVLRWMTRHVGDSSSKGA